MLLFTFWWYDLGVGWLLVAFLIVVLSLSTFFG
jgi:hypothetical protein